MVSRFKLKLSRGFSPAALIVAILALVVATSTGAVFAASKIGTHALKNGAVTSSKIRNHTIQRKDISAKALRQLHGARGARGATGPRGATGRQGDVGAMGPAGPKGDTGPAGATGPAGPKGATGATGAQGVQGIQGVPGPAYTVTTSGNGVANAQVGTWTAQLDCHPDGTVVGLLYNTSTTQGFRVSGGGLAGAEGNTGAVPAFTGAANQPFIVQAVTDDGTSGATLTATCVNDGAAGTQQAVVTLSADGS